MRCSFSSGASTDAGCGSKVTMVGTASIARSPSRCNNMSMTAWCPRCRPSKTPMAITESSVDSFDVSPSRTTSIRSNYLRVDSSGGQYQFRFPRIVAPPQDADEFAVGVHGRDLVVPKRLLEHDPLTHPHGARLV